MNIIQKIRKNQEWLIQEFFVSLVGGWCLSAMLRGIPRQISQLNDNKLLSFPTTVIFFCICTAVFAVLFYWKDNVARLSMFTIVYLFLILCACNGYGVSWETFSNNTIGNVCYQGILCFMGVLAFLYVKEDIYALLKLFRLSRKKINVIVMIIGILLFAFVGAITVLRYLTYSSSTFDFGIFAQMYEYMRQKGTMETTLERNYLLSHFGVHFSPIYYLGLPFYFIFPSPVTVQLIQALMIALPLIPIVLLCRHFKLSGWVSVGLALLYALYPATSAGAFYDIHENCFLTFGILMCVWAIEKNKNIMTAVFVLFTFLVKEDAAIYLMILGVFYIFSRKDKKRGAILVIASAVYFLIAVSIVKSYGLGVAENRWSNLYVDPQGGMFQIIQTILANPAYAMTQLIADAPSDEMRKLQYIMLMMIPVAGMLFATGKKYSRYLLLAPFILFNLLPVYQYMHDITFQYNFGVIALFLYIIIMNLAEMKTDKTNTVLCVSLICAGIMFAGNNLPKLSHYMSSYHENKAVLQEMNTALSTIPKEATVSASGFLTPHLSNHLQLWDQRHLKDGEDKNAEYLAIDTRYGTPEEKFNFLISSGKYQQIYKTNNIVIYHKK